MAYVLRHFSESNPKVQKTTMEPAVQVGFYDPGGTWNYESTYEYPNLKDRENAEKRAVERCNYLNGGEGLMSKNPNIRPSKRPLIKRSIDR